ncbi:hypothetical protein B566_EDAN011075 [Ephemera danica]|nr:hypothetical protein B566_EDAN011075 [Ephemera danica]
MRKKATNNFEKDFFKLMNNAVYGKTMENVRKRMHLELVIDSRRLEKCVASIYFKDRIIYNENLCAIHFHKNTVVLNKPTYVGMAILDISKTLMYDFHYETMLPLYGDFYEDMKLFSHKLDPSDYPKNHPLYNKAKKKSLECLKMKQMPFLSHILLV